MSTQPILLYLRASAIVRQRLNDPGKREQFVRLYPDGCGAVLGQCSECILCTPKTRLYGYTCMPAQLPNVSRLSGTPAHYMLEFLHTNVYLPATRMYHETA